MRILKGFYLAYLGKLNGINYSGKFLAWPETYRYFFDLVLAQRGCIHSAFAVYREAKRAKIAKPYNFAIGKGLWHYFKEGFDNRHGIGGAYRANG